MVKYIKTHTIRNKFIENHNIRKQSINTMSICCTKSKDILNNFLLNSSLHGLKYVADSKLSLFERSFFIASFCLVILISGYFINILYVKWSSHPIIISKNPIPTSIRSIPFPAITICNLNHVKKSQAMKIISESPQNEALLYSFCADTIGGNLSRKYYTWSYLKPVLLSVAQSCEEMLLYCSFGSVQVNCADLFDPKLTDDGVCCTFNSVDNRFLQKNYIFEDDVDMQPFRNVDYVSVNWTPENGYPIDVSKLKYFYPRVAKGSGEQMGLSLILNTSRNDYFCTQEIGQGFKFQIHSPIEHPKINNYGSIIGTGTESRVSITPQQFDAIPSIRNIDAQVRQCLFSDEGNLTYYRTYSRRNCELECEANLLMLECDCILFFLPKLTPTVRICEPSDIKCTKRILMLISSYKYENLTCETCFPSCYELNYATKISSVDFMDINQLNNNVIFEKINNSMKMLNQENDTVMTSYMNDLVIIHFFYENDILRRETVNIIINFTNFLSSIGGLLGLFMGFSIVSLIEIIYFVLIKPIAVYIKYRTNKRAALNRLKFTSSSKRY